MVEISVLSVVLLICGVNSPVLLYAVDVETRVDVAPSTKKRSIPRIPHHHPPPTTHHQQLSELVDTYAQEQPSAVGISQTYTTLAPSCLSTTTTNASLGFQILQHPHHFYRVPASIDVTRTVAWIDVSPRPSHLTGSPRPRPLSLYSVFTVFPSPCPPRDATRR